MKITIESTGMVTMRNGVLCRIWRGLTEGGVRCDLAVALLRVQEGEDTRQFEEELVGVVPPEDCEVVSMRQIW